MKSKAIKIYIVIRMFLSVLIQWFRLLVKKQEGPFVLNFPITNMCNCRCMMCGVWKKEHREKRMLSTEDIGKIFRDPLFSKLRHVGISGGEPFIRKDITQVVEQIIKNCSSLQSISIISNGTLKRNIMENYPQILTICKENHVNCSISFSIDGVGELHDRIRGKRDAFALLTEVLDEFDKLHLPYNLCTTIVTDNVNHLFSILNFARERSAHIYFRAGTVINRLYNTEEMEENGLFGDDCFTAAKFLEWVYRYYETDLLKRMFYFSLIRQLAYKEKRTAGCVWQNRGASLDPDGNLYYCFTNSQKICDCLKDDMVKGYYHSEKVYQHMRTCCSSCIHDYEGVSSLTLFFRYYYEIIRYLVTDPIKYAAIQAFCSALRPFLILKKVRKQRTEIKKVFITGWYGTETLGDKAILYNILDTFLEYESTAKFYLSSIVPYYSKQTVNQYSGSADVKVVGRSLKETRKYIKGADLVVLGGGPLMEIKEMYNIWYAFAVAKLYNKRTVVYGCGLGPYQSSKFKRMTKSILSLSDYTFLRDPLSADCFPELLKEEHPNIFIDPAAMYLVRNQYSKDIVKNYNLFCIRELPEVYCINKDSERSYQEDILDCVKKLVEKSLGDGREVVFFPMHTFFIGNDDREYYYKNLYHYYKENEKIHFYNTESDVACACKLFTNAQMVIGMRFHSVVFAHCMGRPVLAIDYDESKGKVTGFLNVISKSNHALYLNTLNKNSIDETYDLVTEDNDFDCDVIKEIREQFITSFYNFLNGS